MKIKSLFEFISKLSNRERIILYATVGVVGLVVLDRILLTPILSRITFLEEAIRSQEETIEQSLIVVTQEKKIESQNDHYSSYLSKPEAEEKVVTAFLKEVENIAKKSSVYLVDIKASSKKVDGDIITHSVKLNFEAQMEQVINFFYNVSSYKDLVKIEGYQIKPKSEGSSIILCSISISKIIIYE